jgi:hypothetical protein
MRLEVPSFGDTEDLLARCICYVRMIIQHTRNGANTDVCLFGYVVYRYPKWFSSLVDAAFS